MIYNGKYDASYSIVIKANSHKNCLWAYNKIKKLAESFDFGDISISEHKSARKGDVLNREIQIRHTAYAHDTLIFKEAINIIIFQINNFSLNMEASLFQSETTRENARLNLRNETV